MCLYELWSRLGSERLVLEPSPGLCRAGTTVAQPLSLSAKPALFDSFFGDAFLVTITRFTGELVLMVSSSMVSSSMVLGSMLVP